MNKYIVSFMATIIAQADRDSVFASLTELANELEGQCESVNVRHDVIEPDATEEGINERTMFKVYDALRHWGLDEGPARDCINFLLNDGILFREEIAI